MVTVRQTRQTKALTGSKKTRLYLRVVTPGATVQTPSYWDGGSRDDWTIHRPGSRTSVPTNHPFFEAGAKSTVTLDHGTLLVQTGVFCGKPATPTIHATLATLLTCIPDWGLSPEVASQLTEGLSDADLVALDVDLGAVQ